MPQRPSSAERQEPPSRRPWLWVSPEVAGPVGQRAACAPWSWTISWPWSTLLRGGRTGTDQRAQGRHVRHDALIRRLSPTGRQYRGAGKCARAELCKRLVGLPERKRLNAHVERNLRGQSQELLAIASRQVRHRAHDAFSPQQRVRKRGNVAHVDTPA